MKRLRIRTIGVLSLLAILTGLGVVSAAIADTPPKPHLDVDVTTHTPSVSGDGFDSTIYVSVPPQKPSGLFSPNRYDLTQSFVLTGIVLTETAPDGTSTTETQVTCTSSGYPGRNTLTTCVVPPPENPNFAHRVQSHVYPGANTAIYFLGLGPDVVGHWKYTFTVTGLYNGDPLTLTAHVDQDAKP